ncbi:MAG TPA: hypothetical protein VFP59_19425 [Candidatus Angelobacter sp.]|nr:hypothetical protein [Candidatus Angelobacter sp.]
MLAAKWVEKRSYWADNNKIRSPQVLIMFRRAVLFSAVASMAISLGAQEQQKAQKAPAKPADPDVLVLKSPLPPPSTVQQKPQLRAVDLEKRQKLDGQTKMKLIQLLDADFVHTRKYLPLGDKSTVITPEGLVKPDDPTLYEKIQAHGAVAKVGEKVQVTNVVIHDKSVYVEVNGGPKKKSHWYQHVSIMGSGGVATPSDPNMGQATGAAITLEFNKYVPEMTGDELEKLLSPVLDFSVKSAAEVYIETMPPKIRQAMKDHEVLVGMNKDMVIMAKDRPEQKIRERDANGKDYEDWIYGRPPQDVTFVRFYGDEVKRVEIAKAGQQMIVKDKKEVDVKDGVVSLATLEASNSPQDVKANQQAQQHKPMRRPTLRRPGDPPDPSVQQRSEGPVQPASDHTEEPQWGTKNDKNSGSSSQGDQQPPL